MSEKRKYTLGEEIFNSVSHGVGAALSIAGTVVLIVASELKAKRLPVFLYAGGAGRKQVRRCSRRNFI